MKRINFLCYLFIGILFYKPLSAQETETLLLRVLKDHHKGFNYDYLLYIPKDCHKISTLLVEPNNTGRPSDEIDDHFSAAVFLAAGSSVGHDVADYLNIPLLVPVFPRPSSSPNLYTHALDKETLDIDSENPMHRLDLQLISMIEDAQKRLRQLDIKVGDKVFMNGFSASGTFVNRFALLHPTKIKALAAGGINGILTLPISHYNESKLIYPVGVADIYEILGFSPDLRSFKSIPQFYYMGSKDQNDAVIYNDAYNPDERELIFHIYGKKMMPDRWNKVQALYAKEGINSFFKTYNFGHGTSYQMNIEIAEFFKTHL